MQALEVPMEIADRKRVPGGPDFISNTQKENPF